MNAPTGSITREQEVVESTIAALATELRTFKRHRVELLQDHAGKHALIKGSEVVGIFENDVAAAEAGYARFGLTRFLVKQVVAEDTPLMIMGLMSHGARGAGPRPRLPVAA